MTKLLFVLLALLPVGTWAQTGSEIWLFDLSESKKRVVVSQPQNISRHTGYDNQPGFHPTRPSLFYASFNDEGRAEIKSFDMVSGQTTQLTNTPEREYSPTVTPDQDYVSCIIQRDNGVQDLGKYPLDGGPAEVIVNRLTVGYHAWLDNSHIALFVLGTPQRLHLLRLPSQEDTVLATNIGRSLHKVPGLPAISFIQKGEPACSIVLWNQTTKKLTTVASCLPNSEDMAWTPDGKILMSDGKKLFFFDPKRKKTWQPVEMRSPWNGTGITRLAVSADGKKLAVVAAEQ